MIGKSREERYRYLSSIRVYNGAGDDIFRNKKEILDYYIRKNVDRIFYVLSQLPKERRRIIEIGAGPYLITAAAIDLLGHEVSTATGHDSIWPGSSEAPGTRPLTIEVHNKTYRLEEHQFNVERDIFPLPDGGFDLALCNEVIEHLLFNPTHMLCEINRVLKKDGRMILSTGPNIFHWKLSVQLLLNLTIEMPYSGEGPYGRHNRLFSLDELTSLIHGNGFAVEGHDIQTFREMRTKPSLVHGLRNLIVYLDMALGKIPIRAVKNKAGENISLLCRKTSSEGPAFPPELYGAMDPEFLKSQNVVYRPEGKMVTRWNSGDKERKTS